MTGFCRKATICGVITTGQQKEGVKDGAAQGIGVEDTTNACNCSIANRKSGRKNGHKVWVIKNGNKRHK
jgi:hypothetical protein